MNSKSAKASVKSADSKKVNSKKIKRTDMTTEKSNQLSSVVEQYFLEKSGKKLKYDPLEKISVIQVDNFPELGKLTALRFIEWVQGNPEGVVSLPTGKTPEHFIKWIKKIITEWDTEFIQKILKEVGLDNTRKPTLGNLKFVQIDEFYPIDSYQHNSFYYYINKYYFKELGLDPEKALFMNINKIPTPENLPLSEIFPDNKVDLSLRTRFAGNKLERLQKKCLEMLDEFCSDYESKIRKLGGIDFFLGGIGPDGHIGFNVKGSDHFSTTRLIPTNYETQAAAAGDLGGIEVARNRLVITIGLNTISYKKDAVAIIIAAGEGKANIVRDSVQMEASNQYPASALHKMPNARFYLSRGSAFRLEERRYVDITETEKISDETVDRALFNLVVKEQKALDELTKEDFKNDKFGSLILKKTGKSHNDLTAALKSKTIQKLEAGIKTVENQTILHTAPHHDDIMLGYLNYVNHLVRVPSNTHHFSYFTSGFTAVTNNYMLDLLVKTLSFIEYGVFDKRFKDGYFDPNFIEGQNRDVSLYLDGIAARSRTLKDEAVSRRLLRNVVAIYEEDNPTYLKDRVGELINYFKTQYPGKKDITYVQKLKGMMREWEVDVLWGHYGFSVEDVSHLRLGFYQGDIFTENPQVDRDVLPVVEHLEKIRPTIVTVALDPESSGPDTHYKVMQCVSEALKIYKEKYKDAEIKVWGYRNVWSRFHPAEANMFIPASINSFSIMESSFMNSFGSQKAASFPSWEYDGPFNKLAQKILVENYQTLRRSLGKYFFLNNDNPRLRNAKGCLFLKELSLEEFHQYSLDLKKLTELT